MLQNSYVETYHNLVLKNNTKKYYFKNSSAIAISKNSFNENRKLIYMFRPVYT